MHQFFYLRKSKSNSKIGVIYKAVYDSRIPISRDSLKLSVPLKYWDRKNQVVKVNQEIGAGAGNYFALQYVTASVNRFNN